MHNNWISFVYDYMIIIVVLLNNLLKKIYLFEINLYQKSKYMPWLCLCVCVWDAWACLFFFIFKL